MSNFLKKLGNDPLGNEKGGVLLIVQSVLCILIVVAYTASLELYASYQSLIGTITDFSYLLLLLSLVLPGFVSLFTTLCAFHYVVKKRPSNNKKAAVFLIINFSMYFIATAIRFVMYFEQISLKYMSLSTFLLSELFTWGIIPFAAIVMALYLLFSNRAKNYYGIAEKKERVYEVSGEYIGESFIGLDEYEGETTLGIEYKNYDDDDDDNEYYDDEYDEEEEPQGFSTYVVPEDDESEDDESEEEEYDEDDDSSMRPIDKSKL